MKVQVQAIEPGYALFQSKLDSALGKADPDNSVPWRHKPDWAHEFTPGRIVDLGAAAGKFSSAALRRLAEWGCLAALTEVCLIDKDPTFADGQPGSNAAVRECTDVLQAYGCTASVRYISETATLKAGELYLKNEAFPRCDLLLASHVTYYFEDGGVPLIRAGTEIVGAGRLWVVVRRGESPIYRARRAVLERQAQHDPEAGYFAEELERRLRALERGNLLEFRDVEYLAAEQRDTDWEEIAELLMWRNKAPVALNEALAGYNDLKQPLFTERHFVLTGMAQ